MTCQVLLLSLVDAVHLLKLLIFSTLSLINGQVMNDLTMTLNDLQIPLQ